MEKSGRSKDQFHRSSSRRESPSWGLARKTGRVRKLISKRTRTSSRGVKWMGTPVWSHDGILCTGETRVSKPTFAKGASPRIRPVSSTRVSTETYAARSTSTKERTSTSPPQGARSRSGRAQRFASRNLRRSRSPEGSASEPVSKIGTQSALQPALVGRERPPAVQHGASAPRDAAVAARRAAVPSTIKPATRLVRRPEQAHLRARARVARAALSDVHRESVGFPGGRDRHGVRSGIVAHGEQVRRAREAEGLVAELLERDGNHHRDPPPTIAPHRVQWKRPRESFSSAESSQRVHARGGRQTGVARRRAMEAHLGAVAVAATSAERERGTPGPRRAPRSAVPADVGHHEQHRRRDRARGG